VCLCVCVYVRMCAYVMSGCRQNVSVIIRVPTFTSTSDVSIIFENKTRRTASAHHITTHIAYVLSEIHVQCDAEQTRCVQRSTQSLQLKIAG